jgi:hypothetical protein
MKLYQNLLPLLLLALSLTWISCDNAAKKSAEAGLSEEVQDTPDDKVLAQEVYKEQMDENIPVYLLEEVDKLPLFDPSCLTSEEPENCSDEKLNSFLDQQIQIEQEEGVARYVEFTISDTGTIGNVQYVSNATELCEGCKTSVLSAINKMQKWEPAVKDGNPVATRMRIEL